MPHRAGFPKESCCALFHLDSYHCSSSALFSLHFIFDGFWFSVSASDNALILKAFIFSCLMDCAWKGVSAKAVVYKNGHKLFYLGHISTTVAVMSTSCKGHVSTLEFWRDSASAWGLTLKNITSNSQESESVKFSVQFWFYNIHILQSGSLALDLLICTKSLWDGLMQL